MSVASFDIIQQKICKHGFKIQINRLIEQRGHWEDIIAKNNNDAKYKYYLNNVFLMICPLNYTLVKS